MKPFTVGRQMCMPPSMDSTLPMLHTLSSLQVLPALTSAVGSMGGMGVYLPSIVWAGRAPSSAE